MNSQLVETIRQIKTRRRVALTGSPMRNNLGEYYCMLNFVRPGCLGSAADFKKNFRYGDFGDDFKLSCS